MYMQAQASTFRSSRPLRPGRRVPRCLLPAPYQGLSLAWPYGSSGSSVRGSTATSAARTSAGSSTASSDKGKASGKASASGSATHSGSKRASSSAGAGAGAKRAPSATPADARGRALKSLSSTAVDNAVSSASDQQGPTSGQGHVWPWTLPLTHLERLHIKDFALVADQTVVFGPGVNVITGESGSGKSVLVEALSQVLGGAAPQECVRAPADTAVVEGSFLLSPPQALRVRQVLTELGVPAKALPLATGAAAAGAGGSSAAISKAKSTPGSLGGSDSSGGDECVRLVIRREIVQPASGGMRSRVYINGSASSLRVLRELGSLLVDTNGQHSSLALRDPRTQLELLDRIAGSSALVWRLRGLLAELCDVERQLAELEELADEEERERLQKLCDMVRKARVVEGEEVELRRALKRMEARRGAVEQCALVRMAISGEAGAGGVTDALRTIEAQLHTILMQEEQMAPAGDDDEDDEGAASDDDEGQAADDNGDGEDDDDDDDDDGSGEGAAMIEDALEQVAQAKALLAVAEGMVKQYGRQYQWSQQEHDETTARLSRLERIMRAQGCRSTSELLAAVEAAEAKLEQYYDMEGTADEWYARRDELDELVRGSALELSRRRRGAASVLAGAVEGCLKELAMGGSRFDVRIRWHEAKGSHVRGLHISPDQASGLGELGGFPYALGTDGCGLDVVEFLLAAGPAEPLRPLAAVASGGEAARVMLALKAAPAQVAVAAAAAAAGVSSDAVTASSSDTSPQPAAGSAWASASTSGLASPSSLQPRPVEGAGTADNDTLPSTAPGVPIMILDELDSGIGARLGGPVGSILRRMALPPHGPNAQILCVTHLPQVACYASHHLKVGKTTGADGRVTTHFTQLNTFSQRAEEVAAMLGLEYDVAAELLGRAQEGLPGGVRAPRPPQDLTTQHTALATQGNGDENNGHGGNMSAGLADAGGQGSSAAPNTSPSSSNSNSLQNNGGVGYASNGRRAQGTSGGGAGGARVRSSVVTAPMRATALAPAGARGRNTSDAAASCEGPEHEEDDTAASAAEHRAHATAVVAAAARATVMELADQLSQLTGSAYAHSASILEVVSSSLAAGVQGAQSSSTAVAKPTTTTSGHGSTHNSDSADASLSGDVPAVSLPTSGSQHAGSSSSSSVLVGSLAVADALGDEGVLVAPRQATAAGGPGSTPAVLLPQLQDSDLQQQLSLLDTHAASQAAAGRGNICKGTASMSTASGPYAVLPVPVPMDAAPAGLPASEGPSPSPRPAGNQAVAVSSSSTTRVNTLHTDGNASPGATTSTTTKHVPVVSSDDPGVRLTRIDDQQHSELAALARRITAAGRNAFAAEAMGSCDHTLQRALESTTPSCDSVPQDSAML